MSNFLISDVTNEFSLSILNDHPEDYASPKDKITYGSVRITSILPMSIRKSSIHCHLKYRDPIKIGMLEKWLIIKEPAHQVNFIHEHMGMPFSAAFVVCPLTQNKNEQEVELPVKIGLTYDEEISMRYVTSFIKIR